MLAALAIIDRDGVPAARGQRTVELRYGNSSYPPKLVISFASEIATGQRLLSSEFITTEAERVLLRLGFSVVRSGVTPRPFARSVPSNAADSAEVLSLPDLERLENQLLHSGLLHRWSEIRNDPRVPPRSSGVYAWFFTRVPPEVPTEQCFVREWATLLYVGISPKNAKSKSTLRETSLVAL